MSGRPVGFPVANQVNGELVGKLTSNERAERHPKWRGQPVRLRTRKKRTFAIVRLEQGFIDPKQFLGSVGAAMATSDGLQSCCGQSPTQCRITENAVEPVRHRGSIFRKDEVSTRRKKILRILPRSRDKRNSTSHRLERANRRDTV